MNNEYIKELYNFQETDSTNNRAKEYIKNINESNKPDQNYNFDNGLVAFFSDFQTNGRGKLSRKWYMERGKDLAFSVVIETDLEVMKIPMITILAGEAVIDAIEEIYGLPLKLKWPNDVVYNKKKLCGILTEMKKGNKTKSGKEVSYIIIGIGINCNTENFPEELGEMAVSLRNILKTQNSHHSIVDRAKVFNKITEKLWKYYKEFYNSGLSSFMPSIKSHFEYISEKVKINKNGEMIEATVEGISEEGFLIVRHEDGKLEKVVSGEIDEWGII